MGFNILLFLSGILLMGVSIVSFYYSILWYKNRLVGNLGNVMGVNGFLYLIDNLK